MWTGASCDAANTDRSAGCYRCATLRKYAVVHPTSHQHSLLAPTRPALNYATVGRRHGAMYLDIVAAFAVPMVAMILNINGIGRWLDILFPDLADESFWSGVFVAVIYFVIQLISARLVGRTFGKHLLGLRVVDEGGGPASVGQKTKYGLLAPFSLDSAYRVDVK